MSLRKRAASFVYAYNGISDLFRSQPNARIHAFATALVLAAGWYFRITATEWMVICLAITLVISFEAMNTALEHLTNLVSPDYHPLAGRAKDAAAGAVLLAAIGAIIVGSCVFLPRVLAACGF